MKPLGDGFIKLIKMIIAPIIFCTVVRRHRRHGGHEEGRQDRRPGAALLRGRQHARADRRPGRRQRRPARRRHERRPGVARHQGRSPPTPARARCRARSTSCSTIIPNTVVDAFAKGEILQVLLFSVLFGFALHQLRRPRHARLRHDREDLARAVRDRRHHHEGRAARRVRRDGVHDRQVRHRLAASRSAS